MASNYLKCHKIFLLILSIGIVFSITSCKKNDPGEPENPVNPQTGDRDELIKDSLFLYAKEIYLWNDVLPSYEAFNPRQYGTLDAELFDITQIKKDPATNLPYELRTSEPDIPKYSYIDDITTHNSAQVSVLRNAKAEVELDGLGYDIGILTFQAYGTNNSYNLYISAVFPNSPAAKAGLTRGTLIKKINGTTVGTDFDAQTTLIYNTPESSTTTVTLSGVKSDGTAFNDLVLNKIKYTSSPVYKAKTITSGGMKIGYLALARFSDLQSNAKADLDAAFKDFEASGTTKLIIDLRYNGGGYVNTAEYLVNLIAPSSATGTMFKEYYNKTMQNGEATILTHQPLLDENDQVQFQNGKMVTYADLDYSVAGNTTKFSKKGNLNNVTDVVFLVSGNTASASELVINSLKPFVKVTLVGTQTYGKPVGFFPVRLENKYDVYMSLFETKNSLDQGGYFSGFTPDFADNGTKGGVFDDSMHDFGDADESYTRKALAVLTPNAPTTRANAVMSIRGKSVAVAAVDLLQESRGIHQFIGMVETRHKLKK